MSDLKVFGEVGIGFDQLKRDVDNISTIFDKLNDNMDKVDKTFNDDAKKAFDGFTKTITKMQRDMGDMMVEIEKDKNRRLSNVQKAGLDVEKKALESHQRKVKNIRGTINKEMAMSALGGGTKQSTTLSYSIDDENRKQLSGIKQVIDARGRQITVTKQLIEGEMKLTSIKAKHDYTKQAKDKLRMATDEQKALEKKALNEIQAHQINDKMNEKKLIDEISRVKKVTEVDKTEKSKLLKEQQKVFDKAVAENKKHLEQIKKDEARIGKERMDMKLADIKEERKMAVQEKKATLKAQSDLHKQMSQEERERVRNARTEAKSMAKEAQEQQRMILSDSGDSPMTRRAGHLFDYTMIAGSMYTAQRAIKKTIEINKEFEVGQMNLQRILKATASEMALVKDATFEIGKATGNSTKDIQEMQNLWIRTGRTNIDELKQLTEVSAIGINVAQFQNAGDSVSYLNSAINQMVNGDWTQAQSILDSWAKTADTTAVKSTEDLAQVVAKAGSQAKMLGLDFHDLNAVTAILAERMAMTGDVIGTHMKTIFARFQNENNVKKLRELGIEVQKLGESGELTFRDFPNIMEDLNTKFKELKAKDALAEVAKIEEVLGGTRMRATIGNLIEGWDRYEEVVASSMDSSGFSVEQNEKIMETYTKQLEVLQVTLAELAMNIGQAGLMDMLVGLASGAQTSVEWFNQLDPHLRNTVSTMAILITSFGALNLASKRLTQNSILDWMNSIFAGTVGAKDFQNAFRMLNLQVEGNILSTKEASNVTAYLTGQMNLNKLTSIERASAMQAETLVTTSLTTAQIALNVAIKGALIVIPLLITMYKSYTRSMEERARLTAENIKQISSEVENLRELEAKYEKSAKTADVSAEAKEALRLVQIELAKTYPHLATGMSEENTAIATNIDLVKAEIQAKEDLLVTEAKLAIATNERDVASKEKKLEKLEAEIQATDARLVELQNRPLRTDLVQLEIDNEVKRRGKQKKSIDEVSASLVAYRANVDIVNNAQRRSEVELAKQKFTLATTNESRLAHVKILKEQGFTEQELQKVMGGTINTFGAVTQAVEDLDDGLEEINENPIPETFDDMVSKLNKITDGLIDYNRMLDESNSKEGMSAQSKRDIITKHQELIPYLDNEKAMRLQLIAIIEREEKAQKEAYKAMIMDSEQFYQSKIKGQADLVRIFGEYYQADLDNAKSLAEAKQIVEQRLIKSLSQMWAKFYKTSSVAGEGMVQTMGRGGAINEFGQNAEMAGIKKNFQDLANIGAMFDDLVGGFSGATFKDINLSGVKDPKKTKEKKSKDELPKALQKIIDNLEHERKMDIINDTQFADRLEKAFNEYKNQLSEASIRSLEEKIYGLRKSGVKDRGYKAIDFDELKKALTALDKELTMLEKQEKFLNSVNADKSQILAIYNNQMKTYLRTQTELNKLNDNYLQAIVKIDAEIKSLSPSMIGYNEVLKELTDDKKNLTDAIWDNSVALVDNKQSIQDNKNAVEDLMKAHRDEAINNIKEIRAKELSAYSERINALEQMESMVIQIIKKRGEEELKLIEKTHKTEIDRLEEAHKKKTDSYKDELDEYKKMVQGKIDAMGEAEKEDDYQEELRKEKERALSIQSEIDLRSLDNTLEGKNQTLKLRKDLADQNEKIAKMQQKRERDITKKSLQDMIKDKEDSIGKSEEISNNAYNKDKEKLDKKYEDAKAHHEKMYSDEQVYAEAREAILNNQVETTKGKFQSIEQAYIEFEDRFGRGMGILGNKIKNDFIKQLELAQQAIEKLDYNKFQDYDDDYSGWDDKKWDDKLGDTGYNPPTTNNKRPNDFKDWDILDYRKYVQYKLAWENSTSDAQREIYEKRNADLRNKYGVRADKYSYKDLVGTYDKGGIIPRTGTAMVHKDEIVVNKKQQTRLWNLINGAGDYSANISTKFKVATPKDVNRIESFVFEIQNLLNIEGDVTKDTISEIKSVSLNIAEELKMNLNKSGVFRPAR